MDESKVQEKILLKFYVEIIKYQNDPNVKEIPPRLVRGLLESMELRTALEYIDLNPVRAGLVDRPEEYHWSSLGYRFRSSRNDDFLSWNLGFKEYNVKGPKERFRLYREFVYAKGGVDTGKGKILDTVPLPESVQRFIQRTRFFTDAGIIGSREFVRQGFELFQDIIRPDTWGKATLS